MWVTVPWNSAWCPTACRAAWTLCRASGRTRGTGSLKVQLHLYVPAHCWYQGLAWTIISCLRAALSTVSYVNYGPFTSYAPTYDSSFANVSKDDSDLIYSFYGDESSLQGSDRYVQHDHGRTRARWLLRKTSTEAFPHWLVSRCSSFSTALLGQEEARRRLSLIVTQALRHFSFFILS